MSISYAQTTGSTGTATISSGMLISLISADDWPDFVNQVKAAFGVAVVAVYQEDSTVPNFTARQTYRKAVIANPAVYAENAIPFITADGTTTVGSSDQTIVNRILAIWNLLAS